MDQKLRSSTFYDLKLKKPELFLNPLQSPWKYLFIKPSKILFLLKNFSFLITPESIARSSSITSIYNLKDEMSIPNCRIYGTIDNTTNPLNKPIRGFIRIDQCEEEIRSLEVRLMRAEFIPEGRKYTDNLFKDTSEIQNLQICDVVVH
ncbi:unnamed protein product [Lepeophtheirus salmonis]|uniref:(salmon louse) hypothetical protein n=1 Tax=Lepeophtheirus salmonis TaxID=72036 RepID=A0A7R8CN77_LEPSM|nr:unnamed protein product [Lepeophtheirus salmonis]CAF2873073.1 unnamed protein product [Lepeophtheirus salmonis]